MARSWKRSGEKEPGENKSGEEPILKVTLLGSSSPHHTPKPRHRATGCGDKVRVVGGRKPLGSQCSWKGQVGGVWGQAEVTRASPLPHYHDCLQTIIFKLFDSNTYFMSQPKVYPQNTLAQGILYFQFYFFFLMVIANHGIIFTNHYSHHLCF